MKIAKQLIVTFVLLSSNLLFGQENIYSYNLIEAMNFNNENYRFVQNKDLYNEKWDALPQPYFWRTLMNMPNDSALVNVSFNRQIIKQVAIKDWNKLSDDYKNCFRDSVRNYYNYPPETRIFVTSGKKFFYDFETVIPEIEKGIDVFVRNNVDPFYAQAILLIESPNKLQKSNTGAYGSFQLMRGVALQMGLKVNKFTDEREDFEKSAWAAAKLIRTICIPETNRILNEKCIAYNGTELWYKLLVLHSYHAGSGNVKKVIDVINPTEGSIELITTLWQTEAGGFRNASQNYSQLILASFLELDKIIYQKSSFIYPCEIEESRN